MLFLLAGPPGAGKSTVARLLCQREPQLELVRTWTTRLPRTDDPDRRDYLYVDEHRFTAAVGAGSFFETVEFAGYRYGTPRQELERASGGATTALVVVNLAGALTLRNAIPGSFMIYLHCPIRELARRLRRRGDNAQAVAVRLAQAMAELEHAEYEVADRVVSSKGSVGATLSSVAILIDEISARGR